MPLKRNRSFTLLLFHTPNCRVSFCEKQILGTNGKIPKIGGGFLENLSEKSSKRCNFLLQKNLYS